MTRYLNLRVRRNEDERLLTGRARFVDDIQLPGMTHVAFVRSDYAHARLKSVDVSAARERPGVLAVYTAADLGDYLKPAPLLVPPPPIKDLVFHARTHLALAKDKVRYVGEAIAMIVAESLKRMGSANPMKRRRHHTRHQQSYRHHGTHDCSFHCFESFRWSATHACGMPYLNIPCRRERL
jgi:CO/xanthine dehydrogenase Mo-binding subunit